MDKMKDSGSFDMGSIPVRVTLENYQTFISLVVFLLDIFF